MGKKAFTSNYLLNQINWFRKWSLNLAGIYVVISIIFDYWRFPHEALSEIYLTRFLFMVIPIATLLFFFYYQKKLNLKRQLTDHIAFLTVVLIGIGHAEILAIAEHYGLFFPKIGITIILIYAGLLLALPFRLAILSSIIIILYSCYTYTKLGIEFNDVLSYFAFYCMYSSCCILISMASLMILKSNHELIKNTTILATTDVLTGLFNRRYFYTESEKISKQSNRETKSLALLLVDLDNFKSVNDILGHKYGDSVLKDISKIIADNCRRPFDMAARFGGDEFVIIIYDTQMEHVHEVCKNLIKGVDEISMQLMQKNEKLKLGISIGVAENQKHESHSISLLLEVADKALYDIKKGGKNNYKISEKSQYLETDVSSRSHKTL